MKILINLLLLLPLLISCQNYDKAPFDKKEEILRKYPLVDTKSLVLDSLWDKRDSLSYLRLKNYVKNIGMNEVTSIPNWIGEFNSVRIFLVVNEKNKKIKKIPSSIGRLSNLKQIDIKNNEISTIPNSFYNLTNLTYIELEGNAIENLSKKIENLKKLESINLSENPLKSLPINTCELKTLKFLTLENTQIKQLPACLGSLPNLDWINVSGTRLTEFPIEILNAPKLETIDAKRLKLTNYKEVKVICEKKNIRFHYDE